MLRQCHMNVYNIEKDLMGLTPDGLPQVFEKEQFGQLMIESKNMAESFN